MDNNKVVVTIGRQFGSGGRALGKVLSQKLGIKCYDKELLYSAAREAGLNPDFFVNNDERVPKYINGTIPFSFGINPMPWHVGVSAISDDSLYKAQSDFIHDLAQRESCIIVGRTADYVLRDMPGVVSVFVHAPIESRARRIVERMDCASHDEAMKLAARVDKLRANYYNFYTDKKWGAASSYDMTFNSDKMSIDDIAEMLAAYIRRMNG